MVIRTQVYGAAETERHLLSIGENASNPRIALEVVADQMRDALGARFLAQGYGEWAPLKASTLARKAAKGADPRILHETRAMRDSLTGKGGGNLEVIVGNTLLLGTTDRKAAFHAKGTDSMPARPPIGFLERDEREFTRTIQRFIVYGEAAAIAQGGMIR